MLELARALIERPQLASDGQALLARLYPAASPEMIATAVHHLFIDGPEALLRALAGLELSLRGGTLVFDHGMQWELLYHMYNWQQFEVLLPEGHPALLGFVEEALGFAKEGDLKAAQSHLEEIKARLDGSRSPPSFEQL